MFFHISMNHEVLLHPRYFGTDILKHLQEKLRADIEGICNGKYGFVIAITAIDEIGAGVLQPGEGQVEYPIRFKAIVFRPFKGEVLDGIVRQINKIGIFIDVGPLACFVSRHSMPFDLQYCANNTQPCYKSLDEDVVINVDNKLRFKLIGTRVEASCIFGVGTLMDDYLGVITS